MKTFTWIGHRSASETPEMESLYEPSTRCVGQSDAFGSSISEQTPNKWTFGHHLPSNIVHASKYLLECGGTQWCEPADSSSLTWTIAVDRHQHTLVHLQQSNESTGHARLNVCAPPTDAIR
jgi:hypothetical protein